MTPRGHGGGSNELYAIDNDKFLRDTVEGMGSASDFLYQGGFGEDDDLSDITSQSSMGCDSVFRVDAPFTGLAANDNGFDAKVHAA